MGAGSVTIGRRQYAVGLYWENSPGGNVSQAAKEAARQPGQQASFYAVRGLSKSGRVPQFGLAPADVSFKSGQPVLAACLANQQPGSWVGAFRLREGTAVIVVRDDLIVPDGDVFFSDEVEARDRLLQEMGFGGLQRVYAPESWSIPGADTMPLSLLLNDKADIKLHSVEIPKEHILFGLGAVVLVAAVLGGGWYYQTMKEEEQAERLAAYKRAQQAATQMVPSVGQQQVVYPPPERFWEKHPKALDVVRACQESLKQVPAALAGWNISVVQCSEGGLSVTWQRSSGFSKPPEKAIITENAAMASLSIPLPALEPRGSEELMDATAVTRRVLAQDWSAALGRAPDDPLPPPPPGYTGEWHPPAPPWLKRSFNFAAPLLPWTMEVFFADFPGLIVNNLTYSGSSWTVDGVIYENRR